MWLIIPFLLNGFIVHKVVKKKEQERTPVSLMWKNRIGHQPADGPITAPSKSFVVNPDLFQIRMIFILFLCIIKHQSVPIFTRSTAHIHLLFSSCLVLMELMVALEFWEHLLVIQGDWKKKRASEYCATEKP